MYHIYKFIPLQVSNQDTNFRFNKANPKKNQRYLLIFNCIQHKSYMPFYNTMLIQKANKSISSKLHSAEQILDFYIAHTAV